MGLTEDQIAFGESVKNDIISSTSKESGDKEVPFYKAWPSMAVRSSIEGLLDMASIAYDPEPCEPPEVLAEVRQTMRDFYEPSFPVNPHDKAGFIEKSIQRAGKNLPSIALGGGTLLRSLLASAVSGASGQGAEELGFGRFGQSVAEVVGSQIPNLANWALRGRFEPVGQNQERLTDFSRQMGMSEEDIALSAGQRSSVRDIAENIAPRGGRTVRAFERARESIGRVWETLRGRPEAAKALTGEESARLVNNMSKRLSRMPAETRNLIQQDFNDFLGTQQTGGDIIDFWQKLNYYIQRGGRALGTLKEDLLNAIGTISPELAEDFSLTNQLHGNFSSQAQRMVPDIADRLVTLGEAGTLLDGVVTGNVGLLQKVLGVVGGRELAREMVLNPKLQNIGSRFISSMNQGSVQGIIKTFNHLVNETAKTNAEAAKVLAQFDIERYAEELKSSAKKKDR